MGRTLGRLLVVAAIAIPAVLGEPAAVIAAVRHISDHDGGGVGGANATRIDLYPRFENTRIVTQIFGRFRHHRLNAVELWLDTDFADTGPEYRVAWLLGGDGDGVLDLALIHVDGFHDIGERVPCGRMYGAKHLDRRYVEVSVRHNCIGAPSAIPYHRNNVELHRVRLRRRPARRFRRWHSHLPAIHDSDIRRRRLLLVPVCVALVAACSSERSSDGSSSEERDAYAAAMAGNWGLDGDSGFVLIGGRATCVAERWVDAIGVRRLDDVAGEPSAIDPRQGGEFDPAALELTQEQVTTMVDAFDTCGADLVELFVRARADGLDDTTRECLQRELSDDLARALVSSSLTGNDLPAEVTAELEALSRTCGSD